MNRIPVFAVFLLLVSCWFAGCRKPIVSQSADVEPRVAEHIDDAERAAAAKLKAVKDPVLEEIYAYRLKMRPHYNNRRFDELEKEAAALRSAKPQFGNGSWKIRQLYGSLACREDEPESMWQLHDQIHHAWIAAKPESVTARVAYADFLTDYAWRARGSDYADKVTKDGWRLFAERLAAARKVLDEARALPEKDPMWWQVSLTLALGQQWDKKAYDALVAEAVSFEPQFWGYDVARAYSLLPRWYGRPGDWEAYAEQAAARQDGLGAEIYARIVMDMRGCYENVFRETKASWPKTRDGIEIMLKKYPTSLDVVNQAAMLATMAQDRATAKAMFDRLGETYLPNVWRKPERFAHFRNWAETGNW